MAENTTINSNRRAALKALAAATGAAGLAALPTRWGKPVVNVGAVPAHAQTSCVAAYVEVTGSGTWGFTGWNGPPPTVGSITQPIVGPATVYWACGTTGCGTMAIEWFSGPDIDVTVWTPNQVQQFTLNLLNFRVMFDLDFDTGTVLPPFTCNPI